MSDLMTLDMVSIAGQAQQAVNARLLHEFLEVKSKFATWINNRISKYGFIENVDFVTYSKILEKGRPNIEYFISMDMGKQLCMVENNAKGQQARLYFIECERKVKHVSPALPQSFSEALRLAADLQEQLEIAAPKAQALDLLSNHHNATGFRKTAKHLGVQESDLKAKLIKLNWITPNSSPMEATSKAIQDGYMAQSTNVATNGFNYSQAMITCRGLTKLAEYFSQLQKVKDGNLLPDQSSQATALRLNNI